MMKESTTVGHSATKHREFANGRNRLLTAARSMFTRRGYANVGINEVTDSAGVARMTLYNNFPSKSALVVAVYEELVTSTLARIDLEGMQNRSEGERILALFQHFEDIALEDGHRGCPFVHASLQSPEPQDEVYDLVRSYKRRLRDLVFDLLDTKRLNRDDLADQLLLLLDGAAIEMYLQGVSRAGRAARCAASVLLSSSIACSAAEPGRHRQGDREAGQA